MQNNENAFQAFMNATLSGESRWWSWVIGFWFALVVWFYGQIILGAAMGIVAMMEVPDLLDNMAPSEQAPLDLDAGKILLSFLIGVAPFLAILFWLLKGSIKSTIARSITIGISTLIILVTTIACYQFLTSQPEGSSELTSQFIARSPTLYALILLTFPVLMGGFWLTQKFVHRRTFLSLLTIAKRFRWKRMVFSMVVLWIIMGIAAFIGHASGISKAEFVFDASRFWMYLPLTLLLIPLQSATEEIALRGYLNQGIGHYIKSPFVVFFITSAAFAALHLGNPEVAESTKDTSFLIAISGYFFFGMFACILTYIDGGLETAIGMHAANNIFAASMMGYDNSALPTPTIFKTALNTSYDSIFTLIVLTLVCLVMYFTRKPVEHAQNDTNIF